MKNNPFFILLSFVVSLSLVVTLVGITGAISALTAVPGSLDPTFDDDGIVTTTISDGDAYGNAVAIQTDGMIVVAGTTERGSDDGFALARYNREGGLDTSFGNNGLVTTAFGLHGIASDLAIQADGKIIVVGSSEGVGYSYFALARYNPDGSLDAAFDNDGLVTTIIGGNDDATSVAIQADGKIVVAGYSDVDEENSDFALVRYNSDGSLDTSFDGDGIVTTPFGSDSEVLSDMVLQADGKILAAGNTQTSGGGADFALARYNSDGSLDNTFDSDGLVTTHINSYGDIIHAITIQADGKIVAAGASDNWLDLDFVLARYHSDGSLDTSFDGDGLVIGSFGSSHDSLNTIAIQADGKIVVAGYTMTGIQYDFALARYYPDGSLDTSFDGDGMTTTPIGVFHNVAQNIALQTDGKIVAAGYSMNGNNADMTVARYDVAASSSQTIACGGGSATLEGVTITTNGSILATGVFTVIRTPVPAGGAPADFGEMPQQWEISTTCPTYDVDLTFSHTDSELMNGNQVVEANLAAYQSDDGVFWNQQTSQVNVDKNQVAVAGVQTLGHWTMASNQPIAGFQLFLPVVMR